MTIRASRLTPEVMLSAPRRSAGVPNHDGTRILYTVSTHSFADQGTKSEVQLLSPADGSSQLVTDAKGASEPQWIDNNVFLLVSGEKGQTGIHIGDPLDFEKSKHVAGLVDAPISNVKLAKLSKGKYAIAMAAQTTPDGHLFNPETAKPTKSTGKLYTTTFVRHWDAYKTKNRNSIWYGTLTGDAGDKSKRYVISPLTNALRGTGLESPIEPFGGSDHYDLSTEGIIFTAKDPNLNFSANTKTDVYYVPIPFAKEQSSLEHLPPVRITTPGFEGASTAITFSPDGKQAAFLRMKENGYEADKNQLLVIPDLQRPGWVITALPSSDGKGAWNLSPQSITWSKDGKIIYLLAEDTGKTRLFSIARESLPSSDPTIVRPYLTVASISDIKFLAEDFIFISASSLIDSSVYFRLYPSVLTRIDIISSFSKNGTVFGLSPDQVDQYWWPGASDGVNVHALVVKPSNFSPKNKYPLAYAIHGGPQGSWLDSWNTRWNPAVIAEQGYVVVCPNPTGSTGYGQDFTDAIKGQWGGLPYEDLVKGFEFIKENISYIDTNKAVALGASYGGYMMNWINSQPLGKSFQALVCHDGIFSMTGLLATEEIWFPFHDLKGSLWKNPSTWARWDPSRFLENWTTPQLIIHSELDYRLPISEGLSAFNVLQSKGIESQFLMFPDENHWVLKPENSLLWHTVVFDFINPKVGLPSYSEQSPAGKERKDEAAMDSFDGVKKIGQAVKDLQF